MTVFDLERVGGPEGSPAVIFLHGVNGHGERTWTHTKTRFSWPGDLAARKPWQVWTITYPAATHFAGNSMPLRDRAVSVASRLRAEESLQEVDLVLVGHSFGGLVIKQLLRHAHDHPVDHGALLNRIAGTAFIATPHTGAALGTALVNLKSVLGSTELAFDLRSRSDALRELNKWYQSRYSELPRALVLQESYRQSLLGIRLPWVTVHPDSADPGLPGVIPIPIDADHSEIVKPTSAASSQCKALEHFLKDCFAIPARYARLPQKAAAVVYRHGPNGAELLLVQTSGRRWTFPKGNVHDHPSFEAAAEKEAFEEAGVTCVLEPVALPRYVHKKKELKKGAEHIELQYITPFLCKVVDEQATTPEPHRSPTWFPIDDARDALYERRDPESRKELGKVVDAVQAILSTR